MCGLARQQALAVLCALAIAWSLPVAGVAAIGTAGAQEQFEGEIILEGNQATSSTSWSYDIQDLDAVDGLSADLVGDRVTEARSKSATTESETLNLDPRGTSDPEDATMRLTGQRSEEPGSATGTLSDGGSESIEVGGNNPPETEEITLSATYSESDGSTVGTASPSASESVNVGGSLAPQNEIVSITPIDGDYGVWRYADQDYKYSISSGEIGETDTATVPVNIDRVGAIEIDLSQNGGEWVDAKIEIDGVDYGTERVYAEEGTPELYQFDGPPVDVVGSEVDVSLTAVDWDDASYVQNNALEDAKLRVQEPTADEATITHPGGVDTTGSWTSIDLSEGSNSIDIEADVGSVDYDISWTERDGVEDPSVTVGGSTVSHNGVLDGSTTETVDLSEGSNSIDASYSGESNGLDYDLSWTEITTPQNPSIELDGGEETLAHAGELSDGETIEEPISLSTGSHSATVSSDGPVQAEVVWTDVSESVDPSVTVNGETAAYTGTLEEGETTSLDVSDNWIQEGTNTVDISMADAGGGPEPQVDVTYQHDAATAATATIDSTTWTEDAEINRTFASDQSNVEATIPMPDNVVEVDGVEISRDGGGWSSVDEADYSHDGDLQVSIGSVAAGESVAVRSEGSKVRMQSGEIEVVDPTTEGNDLSSTVEIVDAAGTDPVVVDVSETVSSDRAHVVSESEWTTDDSVLYQADGTQELRLPDAVGGSTATIETAPFDIEPQTGEAVLRVENRTEPRISLSPGSTSGDSLSLTWFDGESSQHYELYDVDNDRQVDTGQANSPVLFDDVDDQEATLVIYEWEPSGSIAGVASGDGEGGLGAPLLLLVSLLGLVGSVVVGTRLGVRWLPIPALAVIVLVGGELSTSRSLLATLSGDLLRGSSGPLLAIVAAVLGLAILWVVDSRTARDVPTAAYAIPAVAGLAWLVSEVVTGVPEPLIAFVGGVAVVVGVVALDRQTSLSVPQPIIGGAGIMAFAWVIETIEPGTITRPLEAGIAEVAPLLALASIGLLIWWVRR